MNRIDKSALEGFAIAIAVAIVYCLGILAVSYIPVIFWQVAWAMLKGALPFAIAITVAVYINQRISK